MKKHINTISISIGVFVHNEEKDIGKTLNALLNQDLGTSFAISEILVFSDACTDNTNNIVNSAARNNKSIKLITSNDRRGKSAAINHFLNIAKEEIVISANVAERDLRSVVKDIQKNINENIDLPEGYRIEYGGQFESEAKASQTLMLTSILAIIIIFLLLFQE